MISYHEALNKIEQVVKPRAPQRINLVDALGTYLCEAVDADRDFPPTDRSAMDGFAVRAADLAQPGTRLQLAGEQRAGEAQSDVALKAGQCARIYTGAVLPKGADSVVMIERTVESKESGGTESIVFEESVRAGQHVRHRASDQKQGAQILAEGSRLGTGELTALASVGATHPLVRTMPRVALLSTGDEIVEPYARPEPHQLRNSNATLLQAELAQQHAPARYLGIAEDRREDLDRRIAEGLRSDVLILTGGVSVGAYDLVGQALQDAGVQIQFHGVAMKPGKPVLFGTYVPEGGDHPEGAPGGLVFGLPGNPVSTFACFRLFVLPALKRLAGRSEWRPVEKDATLRAGFKTRPGRRTFHLARLTMNRSPATAERISFTGSGDVLALSRSNGFIVTEAEVGEVEAGQIVKVVEELSAPMMDG